MLEICVATCEQKSDEVQKLVRVCATKMHLRKGREWFLTRNLSISGNFNWKIEVKKQIFVDGRCDNYGYW